MVGNIETDNQPDISLGPLGLWVYGRQFPDSFDYWDGNWLIVTAYCSAVGSVVQVEGPILHLSELQEFASQCDRLYHDMQGHIALNALEPELQIRLTLIKTGQLALEIDITPDSLLQSHWFKFTLDQTYLPPFVLDCRKVLDRYPIRGRND